MMNDPARQALEALMEGNARFREGNPAHPRRDGRRRAETASGQRPFAAILSCADSRVPPEILFDQGIGDLFVVRAAGHVLDAAGLGSLEYAASHLGVPLVVVLGHTRCGAVEAVLAGGETCGSARFVVEAIRPSVERARLLGGDIRRDAVRENVAAAVSLVSSCEPVIAALVAAGSTAVVGAVYDVESGAVEIVG